MRVDEALRHYERALDADPDDHAASSDQLFVQNYLHGQTPDTMRALACRFGARFSAKARPFTAWQRHSGSTLRGGIVSRDLGCHPVGYFLEALLAAADPARLEFIAFPSHHRDDDLTARIRPHFIAWTPVIGLSDEAAARLVHESGIDIPLDLSRHTTHNRLPVFVSRPAPIRAAWLGYFATTGLARSTTSSLTRTSSRRETRPISSRPSGACPRSTTASAHRWRRSKSHLSRRF